MRVAHRDDYDTHAIVGGREIEEFAIVQTAEFFTVLSNTLYSDKPLAVVREVLCNAWDAHIEAGRQDVPIQVTVNTDKLVIKDNGLGIPHNMIHQIYCVYGKSTKENDGRQTGGFGLGSKSPFAYSDHFTVVNCHAGIKTVHAISRGSAQTQGKPDRRLIVSVPSQGEEGVEVSIPIKEVSDVRRFQDLVEQIARFGEMNVQLNGKTVKTIPISTATNNLFVTDRDTAAVGSSILVRYGNVIYPVQEHEDYRLIYRNLRSWLSDVPSAWYGRSWKMILQAPSNAISVTPSRESLSMTETTVATLKTLLTDLWAYVSTEQTSFKSSLEQHYRKAIDLAYARGRPDLILSSENLVKAIFGNNDHNLFNDITSIDELTLWFGINQDKHYNTTYYGKIRIDALIKGGYRRKHNLKRYYDILQAKRLGPFQNREYFKRKIVRPLVKQIVRNPILHPKHLQIASPIQGRQNQYGYQPILSHNLDQRKAFHLLQGVVIIIYAKGDYAEYYSHELFGAHKPRLVYLAPRSKNHVHKNEAVKFFQKAGFHVIDFAQEMVEQQEQEAKERERNRILFPVQKAEPKEKKPEGLMSLANLLYNGRYNQRNHLYIQKNYPDRIIRDNNPEYIFKAHNLSGQEWNRRFFSFGDGQAYNIVKLFGHRGAICLNETQYQTHLKKGRKDGYLWLAEQISEEILTNPRIRTYFEYRAYAAAYTGSSSRMDQLKTLVEICQINERIKKEFHIPDFVTDQDMEYVNIFNLMHDDVADWRYKPDNPWHVKIKETYTEVEKWKSNSGFDQLATRLTGNSLVKTLDLDKILTLLKDEQKTPDAKLRVFCEVAILNALKFK